MGIVWVRGTVKERERVTVKDYIQPLEAECSDVDRAWIPEHRTLTQHISSKKPVHMSSVPSFQRLRWGKEFVSARAWGGALRSERRS